MTLYEALVLVHVVMAVVWVGGDVALTVLGLRANAARDWERAVAIVRDAEWMGTRVFLPSSIILIAAGVWAVIEGPWEFSQAWVSIGFAGWVASAVAGSAYFGPQSSRIVRLAEEKGASSPEVQRRVAQLLTLVRVEVVVFIVVIWAMVTKPGL